MWLLLGAAALAGIAAALGYRGSLEVVNSIAPAEQRSEVVSSYLICMYVGNSLPVIGIGVPTSLSSSLLAHEVFAGVIAVVEVRAVVSGRTRWAGRVRRMRRTAAHGWPHRACAEQGPRSESRIQRLPRHKDCAPPPQVAELRGKNHAFCPEARWAGREPGSSVLYLV